MTPHYPVIHLSGSAAERGLAYGSIAKTRIAGTISLYRSLFQAHGIDWDMARKTALRFAPAIEEHYPDGLEEMQGIASGSGLDFEDILAINCRSEILFAMPDGCSCVGVLPEMSASGHTLLGQTWDWLAPARSFIVILEVEQPGLPTILMAAEAGIIGGKGLNSCGIGVCLNATSIGRGAIGVPLHVMYRQILNSSLISNALDQVARSKRAGSGTFSIGSAEGFLMSVEFTPDNFDVIMPVDRPLVHTNHYLSPLFLAQDTFKKDLTDTFIRLNRLQRLSAAHKKPFTEETLLSFFRDHANYPDSVCSHEDPCDPAGCALCTVYAMTMDLDARQLALTCGAPCEGAVERWTLEARPARK